MESDKWFIENPMEWPRWPFLPMKHPKRTELGFKGTGCLLAMEDKERWPNEKIMPVIVHVNVWNLPRPPNNTLQYVLANFPKTEFASVEEMLAAGWEID